MYNPIPRGDGLFLPIPPKELNLADTLDCGQCFRFAAEGEGVFVGIAHGRLLRLTQTQEGILFHDLSPEEFHQTWEEYFDLRTDYAACRKAFSEDPTLAEAVAFAGGIRILRQDPFETLLSFLISQNNNIPRIKASIERICERFGEPLGGDRFAFPSPQRLAALSPEDFSGLGLGYRDAYLCDCVRRIADGRLDLCAVARMELDDARQALRTVKGVGPKVAECVLLFGFGRTEAFPVDTWMKKALRLYYPQGFPERYQPAGIAQQYLFHYMRTCGGATA